MRLVLIVAAAVLLAGCGGPGLSDKQHDEVVDIAEDVAPTPAEDSDAVRALQSRVDELEAKVEELEGRIGTAGY